ncbi:MAG: SOS response-associated peptidase [Eubacteriales bacterium]|nr:SOS response-associated peptidase [Eubacteriales bacterium]
MCGRYYIDKETIERGLKITGRENLLGEKLSSGDVYPSQNAFVISGKEMCLTPEVMRWGFVPYRGGQLLINARSETALQKPSFSESLQKRRCVIPAKHYYEWDAWKNKVTLYRADKEVLYLAGIYGVFGSEERFTILTTQANVSVRNVHDRMPLMLSQEQIGAWIFDDEQTRNYLNMEPVSLYQHRDYEQMSVFDVF